MKRTFLAIALILAGTAAASAQGYGPRHSGGSFDGMQARGHRYMLSPPVYHGPRRFHRGPGWHQSRRFGWYPRPWQRHWY